MCESPGLPGRGKRAQTAVFGKVEIARLHISVIVHRIVGSEFGEFGKAVAKVILVYCVVKDD